MTSPPDFDRRLTAWLDADVPSRAPDDIVPDALAHVARTRPRPAWLIAERWIPMRVSMALAVIPRAVLIVLTLLLIAAFAATGFVLAQPAKRLPPPTGVAGNGLIAFQRSGQIMLAEPDGSGVRPAEIDVVAGGVPIWSQDGTRFAFRTSDASGSRSLLMVGSIDGSPPLQIADDPISEPWSSLTWAPDGSAIVYGWPVDGDGHFGLFRAPIDGTGSAPIAPELDASDPSWSPDGSTIATSVTDASGRGGAAMDPDGTNVRRVGPASASGYAFSHPSWSPDSRQLVTYVGAEGAHDIWAIDLVSGSERLVTEDRADEYSPAWSPDGTRIAFYRDIAGVGPRIVIVDADGSNPVVFEDTDHAGGVPVWSPDGTRLLVIVEPATPGDSLAMAIVDPDGVAPTVRIEDVNPFDYAGSWQRIAR
jgi:Tol biopolymer transport system component